LHLKVLSTSIAAVLEDSVISRSARTKDLRYVYCPSLFFIYKCIYYISWQNA
jgi:hypothetical protein